MEGSLVGEIKTLSSKSWLLPPPLLAPHHTPRPLRPHPDGQDRLSGSISCLSHLKRAIAKDLGEDRGREVGDDREQDRHPGCVQEDEDNVEGAMFDYAPDIGLPHTKTDCK